MVRHYGFYFLTYNCFLDFNDLQKRKLADMLGPQWNKEELEHFYEAYRKYGRDWKKVSSSLVIRCFLLNKGYWSNLTIMFLSNKWATYLSLFCESTLFDALQFPSATLLLNMLSFSVTFLPMFTGCSCNT